MPTVNHISVYRRIEDEIEKEQGDDAVEDPDRSLLLVDDDLPFLNRLARAMEAMYQTPFERFERYSPYGTPEEIADFLAPYAAAGCSFFNLMPLAAKPEEGIDAVAEVRERLAT